MFLYLQYDELRVGLAILLLSRMIQQPIPVNDY